jgi:hypothetical protein
VSLDFSTHVLTQGRFFERTALLAGLNILITLVVEGLFFFVFGFRTKKSWVAFFALNLATQFFLNAVLYGGNLFLKSYYFVDLFFAEFLVVIVELIGFLLILKERTKRRRVGFVLAANAASFFAGFYLMSILPL